MLRLTMSSLCACAAAVSRASKRSATHPAFARSTFVSRITSAAIAVGVADGAGAEVGAADVGAGVDGRGLVVVGGNGARPCSCEVPETPSGAEIAGPSRVAAADPPPASRPTSTQVPTPTTAKIASTATSGTPHLDRGLLGMRMTIPPFSTPLVKPQRIRCPLGNRANTESDYGCTVSHSAISAKTRNSTPPIRWISRSGTRLVMKPPSSTASVATVTRATNDPANTDTGSS